jgi:predicted nucleotidyltransferase
VNETPAVALTPPPDHPSIHRIAQVAVALGDLRERVVFIGGAIAPLLQTSPPFPSARTTKDVDAVAATASYGDITALDHELRARDFQTVHLARAADQEHGDIPNQPHVHKWLSPGGIEFDLVPSGAHLGGTGSTWDRFALEGAETIELRPGLWIRHASAPAFLAMKWAAHHDRGTEAPLESTDLEDILALIASRPTLMQELRASPPELREYVRAQTAEFLTNPDAGDLLSAHLNNVSARATVIDAVHVALKQIATLT